MSDILPATPQPEQEPFDELAALKERSLFQLARLRAISKLVLSQPDKFPQVLYPVAENWDTLLGDAAILAKVPEPNVIPVSLEYQVYKLWESLGETQRNWELQQEYEPALKQEAIPATVIAARFLIESKEMKKVLQEYHRQAGKKLEFDGDVRREQIKDLKIYLGLLFVAILGVFALTEVGSSDASSQEQETQEYANFPFEESRNMYLAQKDKLLSNEAMLEFLRAIEGDHDSAEASLATQEDLAKWIVDLQRVLREMGLEDSESALYEFQISDLPPGISGRVQKDVPNTLQLDQETLKNPGWALYVAAHEAVHLEAEHIMIRYDAFENFGDFTWALWSIQYRESQAELLTLELLSRLVETGSDEHIKSLAREAIYIKLQDATRASGEFISVMEQGHELQTDREWLHDTYYYSYVPMWKIQEMVHGGFYEIPVVEHGALSIIGNRLQEVPMAGFGRFLWNEGLVQANSSENSPNISK